MLLSALLLGAVTACGGGGTSAIGPSPSTTSNGRTSTGTSTTPSASPSTPGPAGRMTQGLTSPVLLERSGGIAGRKDVLEVRPDGTITVSTLGSKPVTRQLSEAELAAVVSAVKAIDLRPVRTPPRPTAAEADVYRYKIVAEGTIVMTTEQQADGAVRRLLDVLTPLFSAPAPTP